MDLPQDDLKWFGEGFDGFPKRLPEDTVQYVIYALDPKLSSESQVREKLRDVEKAAKEQSKNILGQYIWQRDEFNLQLTRDDHRWCLRGQTTYADSVADEWVIVFLLREISAKFKEVWIRAFDIDGEFLLIEAANALPRWLNPEVAENRVWIHEGKLLIIPQYQSKTADGKTAPSSKSLTLEEALSFVHQTPFKLTHSPMIEEEAFYRIRNYPAQVSENLHHALVTVPRKLAYLLHRRPAHVSAAIEAFYLRDPISLKALQNPDPNALLLSPVDLVTISARFSKVGYAQLKSQVFPPPGAWAASPSPPPGALQTAVPCRAQADVSEDGMKLTCGFEMLLRDPAQRDRRSVRELRVLLEDVDSGDETLPMDAEMAAWSRREDAEDWLDIDFDEFQRELDGGKGAPKGKAGAGFGDAAAHENLKKVVQRFEAFLNDNEAGAEGAEDPDDMDYDDDEDEDEDDESSEGEDKEVSFDEAEFARMMREMMGLPPDEKGDKPPTRSGPAEKQVSRADANLSHAPDDGDSEDEEIQALMAGMEAELRSAGALDLDAPADGAPSSSSSRAKPIKGKEKAAVHDDNDVENDDSEDEDGEVDVDFNLAKNLLASLKGQAGLAGPAGNLMGSMGVRFPRDHDDYDANDEEEKKSSATTTTAAAQVHHSK